MMVELVSSLGGDYIYIAPGPWSQFFASFALSVHIITITTATHTHTYTHTNPPAQHTKAS